MVLVSDKAPSRCRIPAIHVLENQEAYRIGRVGTIINQKGTAVVKRVLLVGVGAAIGWYGHSKLSKGRDQAAIRAEEALRTSLAPENIGRSIGEGAASIMVESTRAFFTTVREQIPALNRAETAPPIVENLQDATPLQGEVSNVTAVRTE